MELQEIYKKERVNYKVNMKLTKIYYLNCEGYNIASRTVIKSMGQ